MRPFTPISVPALSAAIACFAAACGGDPEEMLLGCWAETNWVYERVDEDTAARHFWNDGVRPRMYPAREAILHEAERWEFHPRGELRIWTSDGSMATARWRLKGRGHVLAIRHPGDHFEVYDIKKIDDGPLVLHFDMGVEVRGIARLEFAREACEPTSSVITSEQGSSSPESEVGST